MITVLRILLCIYITNCISYRSREGGNYTQFGDDTTYDDVYLRRYEHFPEYYR
jgi:hypothetical protein